MVSEWILEVGNFFKLHPTTTHAAISYLDRLHPDSRFSRVEWQYLAMCCILISSKYNECEENVPTLDNLEQITQQHIPNETILNYEIWVLTKLSWKLNGTHNQSNSHSRLKLSSSLDLYLPSLLSLLNVTIFILIALHYSNSPDSNGFPLLIYCP